MSEYLIEGKNILELIPQRLPIVMIDKLISCDKETTVSGLLIKENNLFSQSGYLQESGMIENIAQTAAVRVGYICKQTNQEVPVGFIGAVKGLKIYKLPKVGTNLLTSIKIENEIFDVTIISGKVNDIAGEIYAECEMKIFLQKES
ncbi:MAG: hydroxymyristoyl-ACP dehydratase [Bacteroidales bacterium]|nr:hydroxymyristoyl-ACP dehydratase [Bacteroidales bacterium]